MWIENGENPHWHWDNWERPGEVTVITTVSNALIEWAHFLNMMENNETGIWARGQAKVNICQLLIKAENDNTADKSID